MYYFRFSSRCNSKQSVNNNTESKNSKFANKSSNLRSSYDNKVTSLDKEPRPAWGPTSDE